MLASEVARVEAEYVSWLMWSVYVWSSNISVCNYSHNTDWQSHRTAFRVWVLRLFRVGELRLFRVGELRLFRVGELRLFRVWVLRLFRVLTFAQIPRFSLLSPFQIVIAMQVILHQGYFIRNQYLINDTSDTVIVCIKITSCMWC